MGGTAPLGYGTISKKLVVNQKDAATVKKFDPALRRQSIFRRLDIELSRQQCASCVAAQPIILAVFIAERDFTPRAKLPWFTMREENFTQV